MICKWKQIDFQTEKRFIPTCGKQIDDAWAAVSLKVLRGMRFCPYCRDVSITKFITDLKDGE